MNLKDRVGLWADEKLNSLYFQEVIFKELRERFLNLFIPTCSQDNCKEKGEPCWLPNWGESDEEVIQWFCYSHMHGAGFCRGCHQFWAGCEDFEFDSHGLCSNCRHDPDLGYEDEYSESEDQYFDYP